MKSSLIIENTPAHAALAKVREFEAQRQHRIFLTDSIVIIQKYLLPTIALAIMLVLGANRILTTTSSSSAFSQNSDSVASISSSAQNQNISDLGVVPTFN